MRKPKNKTKRVASLKRATKRSNRLKSSRKKVSAIRLLAIKKRVQEKKKYLEFLKKLEEARLGGKF